MNNKDKVVEYCKKFIKENSYVRSRLESLETAEYILQQINNNKTILDGCPFNYGLPDFIGLCERNYKPENKLEMCVKCWKEALGI